CSAHPALPSFPTRRSSDLIQRLRDDASLGPKSFIREVSKCLGPNSDKASIGRIVSRLLKPDMLWRSRIDTLLGSKDPTMVAEKLDRKSTRLNSSHVKISYA